MERSGYNSLLNDIGNIDQSNIESLEALRKQYPYYQNIHLLLAKAYQKAGSEQLKPALNKAAIYSVDRAHLKQVFDGTYKFVEVIRTQSVPKKPVAPPKPEDAPTVVQKVVTKAKIEEASKPEPEKPKTESKAAPKQPAQKVTRAPEVKKPAAPTEPKKVVAKKEVVAPKPKPQSAPPKPKAQQPAPEPAKATPPPAPAEPKSSLYDELNENLKLLRERKKAMMALLEDKPQKKSQKSAPRKSQTKKESQIRLIEKFIKNEPQLDKPGLSGDESDVQEDLATKKLKQSDKFVTETLAKLLVKQRKYDKAVDIYEKLKLKFPKKTAYFASQIEKINQRGNVV